MAGFVVETRQHHGKWETLCAVKTETKAKAVMNMVIATAQAPFARYGRLEFVIIESKRAEDLAS